MKSNKESKEKDSDQLGVKQSEEARHFSFKPFIQSVSKSSNVGASVVGGLGVNPKVIAKEEISLIKEPIPVQNLLFEPNINLARRKSVDYSEKHELGHTSSFQLKKKESLMNDVLTRFEDPKTKDQSLKKLKQENKINTVFINQSTGQPQVFFTQDKESEEDIKKKEKEEEEKYKKAAEILKKEGNSYEPIELPFNKETEVEVDTDEKEKKSKNTQKESVNINFFDEGRRFKEGEYFLFQFPKFMPMNKDLQKRIKNDELDNEEPEYDKMGFLIAKEFENVFKTIPNNSQLGKLKFYKSGKVKLQLGENLFDIHQGINTSFGQEFSVLSKNSKELFILGNINKENLVVSQVFE